MRILLTGILGAAMLAFSFARAPAASTCTSWVEYDAADDSACVAFLKRRTSSHDPQVSGDTLYYWSGENVSAARCIMEHGIIVFFAWNRRDEPAACNSYQWLKNVVQ